MRLGTTNSSTSSTSNGGGYRTVEKVKHVTIRYDEKPAKYMQYNSDICLDVTFTRTRKDGEPYDKTITISGNFNREKKNWGSAFKVQRFFEVCDVDTTDINDDWSIPDSWLDMVVGKEFSFISYPSTRLKEDGTPWWNDYDLVMHPNKGSDAHKAEFMKSVNDGWVKDYSTNTALSDFEDNSDSVDLNSEELAL